MTAWREGCGSSWLKRIVENRAECKRWTENFNATAAGEIDSWAYRWTLAVWRNEWLTALPYRNLVTNLGFGPDATHTRDDSSLAARPLTPMGFPLVHPASLSRDWRADEHSSRLLFCDPGIGRRLLGRIRRLCLP